MSLFGHPQKRQFRLNSFSISQVQNLLTNGQKLVSVKEPQIKYYQVIAYYFKVK